MLTIGRGPHLPPKRSNQLRVCRLSRAGSEGPYSMAMEAGGLALYAGLPDPLPYWTLSFYDDQRKDLYTITHTCERPVASITFLVDPKPENGFRHIVEMRLGNASALAQQRAPELCNLTSDSTSRYGFDFPGFSATLSFLRLDWDGNLRIYSYTAGEEFHRWDITYELSKSREGISECGLPRKCGSMGLCEDSNCGACPQPDGLKAWSTKCSPLKLPKCGTTSNVPLCFYKLVGAEHFSNKYVAGIEKVKVAECRRRCLSDCKCAAFFYREESSTCFLTQNLNTLQQLGNSKHLAFIKYAKKV